MKIYRKPAANVKSAGAVLFAAGHYLFRLDEKDGICIYELLLATCLSKVHAHQSLQAHIASMLEKTGSWVDEAAK
jgi:hypothetical protein